MKLREVVVHTLRIINRPVAIPDLIDIIWDGNNNGRDLEFYDALERTFKQGHVSEPKGELSCRIYSQHKSWHEVVVDKTVSPHVISLSKTREIKQLPQHNSCSIDFIDRDSFITRWSSKYKYHLESKYDDNINKPLTELSIMELFEWKNGSALSTLKKKSVLENYPPNFVGDKEQRYLNPNKSGGAIWNIFYLHCLDPIKYPIFGQHALRAMKYIQTKEIIDTRSINNATKYQIYKNEYMPFINSFVNMDHRTIDRALFMFGKFLKKAKKDELKDILI